MASPFIVIKYIMQIFKLANTVVMEIVELKLPTYTEERGTIHRLVLLLVLHGLRAVVCLKTALGERTEPHTSHLSILKGKENS